MRFGSGLGVRLRCEFGERYVRFQAGKLVPLHCLRVLLLDSLDPDFCERGLLLPIVLWYFALFDCFLSFAELVCSSFFASPFFVALRKPSAFASEDGGWPVHEDVASTFWTNGAADWVQLSVRQPSEITACCTVTSTV